MDLQITLMTLTRSSDKIYLLLSETSRTHYAKPIPQKNRRFEPQYTNTIDLQNAQRDNCTVLENMPLNPIHLRPSSWQHRLIVAPNGVAYAPPAARPGVLPRLLAEILGTRIMVKAAMKRAPKSARVLQRILNARQFCLKLIANVTYGYTAAGFSGRMPMAELADSIVQVRHVASWCEVQMPGYRAETLDAVPQLLD